jgi:hypothetical protein
VVAKMKASVYPGLGPIFPQMMRQREQEKLHVEHVIFVRSVMAAFARQEVLGKAVQMPLSH